MADERASVAHLLRRTTFGPLPGQVERLAQKGVDKALREILLGRPLPPFELPPANQEDDTLAARWLSQMRSPAAGLHEKMVWFWHGHFTSGVAKVDDPRLLWKQHALLRRHALGSFRDLVQEITVDPAMLQYLDGDGSTGDAPNENYARELMELFTLGRRAYTEKDVRAAARALAGWSVDDAGRAVFDEDAAFADRVTFLGRTGKLRARDIVDIVCDQPQCAAFIAGKVYRYLAGGEAPAERCAELAAVFRSAGLQIQPLAAAILLHPSFLESRMNRPRFPVEWVTAASAAAGVPSDAALCEAMGQLPFNPPSVAGWPPGERWLSAGVALARSALAVEAPSIEGIAGAADPVAATLERCSLYEVSDATLSALREAASAITGAEQRAAAVLGLALASPEFALA